jgi:hypothetical protein
VAFLAVPPPPLPAAKQQPPVWSDDDDCEEAALTAAAGEPHSALTTTLTTAAAPCLSLGVSTLLPLTGLFIALSVGAEVSFGAFVVPYAMGQDAVSSSCTATCLGIGFYYSGKCLFAVATCCIVANTSSSSSSRTCCAKSTLELLFEILMCIVRAAYCCLSTGIH